ncbi:prepilin-type N-terminal cleavage/methylation domain-containing protein [bacterium]|nr:prepilin-type N-terminal cleavage/methylation domain-containing protein [bacterium]
MTDPLSISYGLGRSRCPTSRQGFTLVELSLAVTLAAVFCAIVAPILVGIAQQRRTIMQEQLALAHMAGILEDLTCCPPDQIDARIAAHLEGFPESLQRLLPEALLEIVKTTEAGEIPGYRIACQIRWRDRHGQWTRPLCLAGWNHQSSPSASAEDQP